jgi:branched-chain amino acid transport system substrate-binding protein
VIQRLPRAIGELMRGPTIEPEDWMTWRKRGGRARRAARIGLPALVAGLCVLAAAGCGSDKKASGSSNGSGDCNASVGMMTVLTGAAGPQGREQLHWAQLAVDNFNKENGTAIKIVEGDDQLDPAQGATVAQQFVSNKKIVAVIGPESDGTVDSAGPILGRAGLVMVSPSATSSRLTNGKYKTFYRVIPPDSLQGSQDAKYMSDTLKVKKVLVIDDQSGYSKGIADVVVPALKDAGVDVQSDSVSSTNTDYSALVSKVTGDTDVVFLPWMLAANAQLFGDQMKEQGKKAHIFGTDGVFSPQDFTVEGSYLSTFSPDLVNDKNYADLVKQFKDRFGQFGAFGLPTYPASQVILNAIKKVCDDGDSTPDAGAVADAVKDTDISKSVLGQSISFEDNGEMKNAKFYVYTIKDGKYVIAPS